MKNQGNDTIEKVVDYLRKTEPKLRGAFPLLDTWVLGGKITDNDADVTRNSLLGAWDGSTGIADVVIREQLKATGANPKFSIFGFGLAIEMYPAVETQSIMRQVRAAGMLTHEPGEDPDGTVRTFKFAEYADTPVNGVASGATAELTASSFAKTVDPKPCRPFLLNMERDTFTASSTVAVNAAADFLFLVKIRGLLAPNNILSRPLVEQAIGHVCGRKAA